MQGGGGGKPDPITTPCIPKYPCPPPSTWTLGPSKTCRPRAAPACRLFELRTRERELVSEISGGQGQNKNLAARIASLDEQVVRQQELLYGVEFQLQQMERKVARAQGVRSEEESRALNARIAKLTSTLEEVNVEHSMLLEQVKHSEEDLLKARRVNAGLRAERGKLEETLAALRLENEMVGRQAKAAVGEKEKAMVDHDVMKLVGVGGRVEGEG